MEKTCGILPNMIPMRDIKQISDGDRLFFEKGYKRNINYGIHDGNWVRTGEFLEIKDIKKFLTYTNVHTMEEMIHHNFMLIKKK